MIFDGKRSKLNPTDEDRQKGEIEQCVRVPPVRRMIDFLLRFFLHDFSIHMYEYDTVTPVIAADDGSELLVE